jgi:glucokinase
MAPGAGATRDVVLAVDVGGTKMAAGLVTAGGDVVARCSAPTPRSGDAEVVFGVVAALVTDLLAGAGVSVVGCGAGCGGPMAPGGEAVSPLHIPAWRDFPLRARLAALAGVPAWVDNDAKALARGEGWAGAARDVADYLAMVVSTGVGGGIVSSGRLLEGAGGNAGHIGHVVVEPDGRPCACGGRGCLEAEASGPAIAAFTGRPAAEASAAVRRRVGTLVGRAVATTANLLDLRLAVVAGSVALGYGDDFFGAAQAEADARAQLSFSRGVRIVPPARPADAALLGAAAVAWHGLGLLPPDR